MENFFVDDKFHSDLESLMSDMGINDDDDIKALEEDWSVDCEESTLEKMFQVDEKFIVDSIVCQTDKWEDRFPDPDNDEREFAQIKKAIRESVDIEKMNSLLPELYYPNGKKFKITKKDLLEYCS